MYVYKYLNIYVYLTMCQALSTSNINSFNFYINFHEVVVIIISILQRRRLRAREVQKHFRSPEVVHGKAGICTQEVWPQDPCSDRLPCATCKCCSPDSVYFT